jgi:alpha-1,3-mannosyltransferase
LKILHVARQYAPSVGGIQTMVGGLAHEQLARGHDVAVATLRWGLIDGRRLGPPHEWVRGVEVHRVRHLGPRQYAMAPGVARLLAGRDIVHVHSMDFFCDFLAALSPWHRVPMLLTSHGLYFHDGDPLRLKSLYLRTVTRVALRAYREIVAVSEHDSRLLRRVTRPVTIIPNGIDLSRFERVERRPGPPTLLAVGMGEPRKRADLLLAAYEVLRRLVPRVRLVMTGTNRRMSGGPVEAVGVVSDDELVRLLGESTLVLSASDYEGFGYGVVEALAAGVPAVVRPGHPLAALDCPGSVNVVDFLEPRRAADELARMLTDTDRLREASIAARRIAHRFSWPHVADRYEQVYARAVGGRA